MNRPLRFLSTVCYGSAGRSAARVRDVAMAVAMVALLGGAPKSFAGALVWEKTVQTFQAESGQNEVRAAFVFRNGATRPIRITDVETTCGCTTATPAKSVYGPGESGVVNAVFTIGDLFGLQEKTLLVNTDEPNAEPDQLTLRVEIVDSLALGSRWAVWRIGSEPKEKVIACAAKTMGGIKSLRLVAVDPAFDVKIVPIEAERRFELRIRPVATATPTSANLELEAEIDGVGRRVFNIFAAVR